MKQRSASQTSSDVEFCGMDRRVFLLAVALGCIKAVFCFRGYVVREGGAYIVVIVDLPMSLSAQTLFFQTPVYQIF